MKTLKFSPANTLLLKGRLSQMGSDIRIVSDKFRLKAILISSNMEKLMNDINVDTKDFCKILEDFIIMFTTQAKPK